ncbi:unnamed protein product [Pipistrellus nathusii]|uniref:Uncharacterized protein n=1 Tax=Pipistrellus nathusii TaxID=59473 RepID=A0ABP0AC31_PIPNA
MGVRAAFLHFTQKRGVLSPDAFSNVSSSGPLGIVSVPRPVLFPAERVGRASASAAGVKVHSQCVRYGRRQPECLGSHGQPNSVSDSLGQRGSSTRHSGSQSWQPWVSAKVLPMEGVRGACVPGLLAWAGSTLSSTHTHTHTL